MIAKKKQPGVAPKAGKNPSRPPAAKKRQKFRAFNKLRARREKSRDRGRRLVSKIYATNKKKLSSYSIKSRKKIA
jgi:hypothetical protein